MSSELLTNSRLKDARSCLRLHHIKYELGYRPVEEAESTRFGSLWHRGLEIYFGAIQSGLVADEALRRAAEALDSALATGADPFDHAKAVELLHGYHLRWDPAEYEVLGVELGFEAPMVNPATGAASRTWRVAGKIDLVLRDRAGRVLIGEHKTSSEDISTGSDYWRRLRLDGQISMYYAGARTLGFDVEGCVYDVVQKPALRPLKATPPESRKYTKDGHLYANQREQDETPDEFRARVRQAIAEAPTRYYARGEVVRLEDEMADAMHDVWQIGRVLRESALAGRAPKNPDACLRYGRNCEFFAVCAGEASLEDPTKFRRSAVVHPELQHDAERGGEGCHSRSPVNRPVMGRRPRRPRRG